MALLDLLLLLFGMGGSIYEIVTFVHALKDPLNIDIQ